MKKIILLLVDACTPRIIEPAMQTGNLPTLQKIRELGSYDGDGVSIFPSITHAALSSLITGVYPHEHGILGSNWYIHEQSQLAYMGADKQVVFENGFDQLFEDMVVSLNDGYLQAQTLFEQVEAEGKTAASLNYLVFRGRHEHQFNTPLLLRLLPSMRAKERLNGPSILCYGDFVRTGYDFDEARLHTGTLNWFGMKDDCTADLLEQLAENKAFPDLTVAYFPENDYKSHHVGPDQAIDRVENFDHRLGKVIELYGGWEPFLDDFCLIITADHSHDKIRSGEEATINLDQILESFMIAPIGKPDEPSDIVIGTNMRMAHIYLFDTPQDSVIERLLQEPRIDQIIWQADNMYHVATPERGKLSFWYSEAGQMDAFGNSWEWAGELTAVDATIQQNQIQFGDYPNVFERIAGLLDAPDCGDICVTAKPSYEFELPRMVTHVGGGSHGSLHQVDSLIPRFVAGLPEEITLPKSWRLIDFYDLCLQILD